MEQIYRIYKRKYGIWISPVHWQGSRDIAVGSKREEPFAAFEWDEAKRRTNLKEHGIDFEDAATIFSRPYLRTRSDRNDEVRFVAIGCIEDVEIAVVYMVRRGACRIISARRARTNEREEYHEAVGSRSQAGQD
jgi:uncharacterized DUF497 family protein